MRGWRWRRRPGCDVRVRGALATSSSPRASVLGIRCFIVSRLVRFGLLMRYPRSLHGVRARCFGVQRITHVVEQRKSRRTGKRRLPVTRAQVARATATTAVLSCSCNEWCFLLISALLPRRSNIRCTRSSSWRRRRSGSANFTRLFIFNDQIPNAPVEFIFEKTNQSMKFTHSKPKSTR